MWDGVIGVVLSRSEWLGELIYEVEPGVGGLGIRCYWCDGLVGLG